MAKLKVNPSTGAIVLGILGGILAGYVYSESRQLQRVAARGRKAIGKATEGVRLPMPDFAMKLPSSVEDFDLLDQVICDCANQIQAAQPDMEFNAMIVAVRDCVAEAIYPDFPWPPIPGDHTTVSQFWTVLGYEVGRSAVEGSLCPVPENEAEEETSSNPVFIPPPRRY